MTNWETYKKTMLTPPSLWAAAKENDLPLLARLHAEGGGLDTRDERGYSPLMLAAYSGHADAVDLLLRLGADPNSIDLAGNTVLMGATFKGYDAIVRALLAAGANATTRNLAGLDARGFAVMFGRTHLLELFPHLEPA